MKISIVAVLIFSYLPDLCWLAYCAYRRLRRPKARVPTNAMVVAKS